MSYVYLYIVYSEVNKMQHTKTIKTLNLFCIIVLVHEKHTRKASPVASSNTININPTIIVISL